MIGGYIMSKSKMIIVVFFMSFLGLFITGISNAGINEWTSIGLSDTYVKALAFDPITPSTIYAGTYIYGIFKSTNSGGDWTAINTGLTDDYFSSIAVDPKTPLTIYTGSYNDGVIFKSTNGGSSWTTSFVGGYANTICALAIDPITPSTIYAGTCGIGVFKSTNSGGDWTAINTGLPNTDEINVYSLAIDPITPSTIYAGTDSGVFKSTNGGDDWTQIKTGLTDTNVTALAIDPITPSTIYAGIYLRHNGQYINDDAIFKSTNGGSSWNTVMKVNGLSVYDLAIDPNTTSTIYAGTDSGVFKSTNGGADWTAMNTGLTSSYAFVLAIDPITPSTIYAGTSDGVFDFKIFPSIPPFFEDDFNDGVADGWNEISGIWSVINGEYVAEGGSIAFTGDYNWTNYSYKARIMMNPGDNDFGLIFYAQSVDEYLRFTIWGEKGKESPRISHMVYDPSDDDFNSVGEYANVVLSPNLINGKWYDVKLVLHDNSIFAYVDDELVAYSDNLPFDHGAIGLTSIG
jgi:hypothetical protein